MEVRERPGCRIWRPRCRYRPLVELRSPAPAPMEKINDEYRYQLWYFTTQVTKTVALLTRLRTDFAWPDDITQTLDIDPANLV